MKRVVLVIFSCLLSIGSLQISFAQDYETGDPYMMDQIINQMSEELNDVPVNIRRIAVYKINYSSFRFTTEEIEYIRAEVEYAFRQYAGLTVLSPPELEPNDKMKIVGSDSTLQILNVRGRSLADVSPELLAEITSKYGVQGLVELSVQRRVPEGLVLAIRMMNPVSREVVWTKSFISNEKQPEVVVDKGKTSVIKFGVGSKTGENIFYPDTVITADSTVIFGDSTLSDIIVDLHASFTYRQPLNEANSAYIGFTGGFHILRAREADEFSMTLLEFGVSYYQAITPEKTDLDLYRVMMFVNGNVQFPLGKPTGETFSVMPGLMLNLSDNLGLLFYSSITLSGETLTLENSQQVTYSKIGYGVQGVIRF